MSESYRFDVAPRGKQRPRSTIQGGKKWTYTPRETQEAEDELKMLLLTQPRRSYPAGIDLEVDLVFTLRDRANEPDIDQLAKLVMDAFNDMLWADDKQIVRLAALKRIAGSGETPGIDMTVRRVYELD